MRMSSADSRRVCHLPVVTQRIVLEKRVDSARRNTLHIFKKLIYANHGLYAEILKGFQPSGDSLPNSNGSLSRCSKTVHMIISAWDFKGIKLRIVRNAWIMPIIERQRESHKVESDQEQWFYTMRDCSGEDASMEPLVYRQLRVITSPIMKINSHKRPPTCHRTVVTCA